jgi:PiT family inorganic phosphate transporter
MVDEILLSVGVAIAFVFGWNNSSFLIGNGEGSGSLTLREALLVSSTGLLLGVLFGGSKMVKSLSGSITATAGDGVVLAALVVSLALTVVFSAVKLPVSFSTAIVGGFAGAAYASSLPLNGPRLEEIVGFWFVSPLLAAVLAYALYQVLVRYAATLGLVSLDSFSRYGVILTSLTIAFVLAANNIGLIYGVVLNGGAPSSYVSLGLVIVAIFGMVALGRGGVTDTIGDKLLALSPLGVIATLLSSAVLILVGTQFAIPISISQCLLGGMFGAVLTKQFSVINVKLASESVALWVVGPLLAFLLAYLIIRL